MDKKYIVTERAHFMCPNMFFGMIVQIVGRTSKAYICKRMYALLPILITSDLFGLY